MNTYRILKKLAGVALLAMVGAGAASAAKAPVVGMYYFDGWADRTPGNYHISTLPTKYPEREPLSGWYDDSAKLVHQQIKWARRAGVNFFIFDWYDPKRITNAHDQSLNSATAFFRADKHRHGMRYALLYVNNGGFSVPPAEWDDLCHRWVTENFKRPGYFKIDGKPLLVVFSAGDMRKAWGGDAGVASAWGRLRATAKAAGLPGVFVVCCATPGPKNGWTNLDDLAKEGYDAYSGYNYPGVAGTVKGANPYQRLIDGSVDIWNDFAADGRRPYIPVVTDGWDAQPWNETPFWYVRTPAEVEDFVARAVSWEREHPKMEVLDKTPLIFIEAWNELGEGSYVVPTHGAGFTYVDAIHRGLHVSLRSDGPEKDAQKARNPANSHLW